MEVFLGLALFLYLIPTIIGWDKKNRVGITILNIFMGWSLLGWLAVLIWALMDKRKE
jgi:hypothetical protein